MYLASVTQNNQMTKRVTDECIQAMRAVLGSDHSDMELIRSLHLARNDVQGAINILLDTPRQMRRPSLNQESPDTKINSLRQQHPVKNEADAIKQNPVKQEVHVSVPKQNEVKKEADVSAPVKLNPAYSDSIKRKQEADFNVPVNQKPVKQEVDVNPVIQNPVKQEADAVEVNPKLQVKAVGHSKMKQETDQSNDIVHRIPETKLTPGAPEIFDVIPLRTMLPSESRCTGSSSSASAHFKENFRKRSKLLQASDESSWWLLEEVEVMGYSTSRGCKLQPGDELSFNFPKPNNVDSKSNFRNFGRMKTSSEIVRFSTESSGEVGRLPSDWAKCLIPLVHSEKMRVLGTCKMAPQNLSLMSIIVLNVRLYLNQSFFKAYNALRSSPSLEETTHHPLPSLLQLLGKTPFKKADFTPEDLHSYTHKRLKSSKASDNSQFEVSEPPEKRPKIDLDNGSNSQEENEEKDEIEEKEEKEEKELSDSEVDRVVGTTDSHKLQEMEPPETLRCDLRPYQKQALFWMTQLEIGLTREDASKTLHPCWAGYSLADKRASAFYVNAFSGEATLDFPSALQTAKGGILGDAMGLGKTVMTIALLAANRGKGGASEDKNSVQDMRSGYCLKSTIHKGGGTLIICPMTLLSQWQTEIEAHVTAGVLSVYAYYGPSRVKDPKFLAKHDIVLTTYGIVQSEYTNSSEDGPIQCIHWFRIVLDEAHSIKASKSISSQAVSKLVADRRWCLTGTPVQNKLEDLFSLLHFLRVEPWSNWGWWNKLIQRPYEAGDERGLRLLQAILKPLMLRRTKDSTDKDGRPILVLPPMDSQIIECDLTDPERDFYDALYKKSKVKFDQFVEQGKVLHNYASILELLLRLRQCCDHPFLVMSRGDTDEYADLDKLARRFLGGGKNHDDSAQTLPSKAYVKEVVKDLRKGQKVECPICLELPEDAVLTPCAHQMCRECLFTSWRTTGGAACPVCRQNFSKQELITVPTNSRFRIDVEQHWTESSKVKALLQQLQALKDAGSKSIVYSQWTAFLDLLEIPFKRLKFQYLRLDGTLTQQQREKVIKEFGSNSNITILLISLKAGGVGINLTAASSAFLLDPWWNPAVEEQAIMRIHRIGQTKSVSVKRFIVKGTVEERMQQVQARKQRLIAGALTDGEVRIARIEELKMLFR